MPINEYECLKCQTKFEFMKIKSDEVVTCPTCGMTGEKYLEKAIPKGTDFQLKGTGWYSGGYSSGRDKK